METGTPTGDLFRPPMSASGMRVGLFGGSFDPPHEGHLAVSQAALRALALDQVWWLVSPQNPLKPDAPSRQLVERIRAAKAFARHPAIHVTGIEAALGTVYTADTLRALLPRLPGVHSVWIMGADGLANFHRWREWQAIAAMVPLAVFNRPGLAFGALASPAATALSRYRIDERAAATLPATPAPAWVFLPRPHISLSSTELRRGGRRRPAS